VPLVLANQTSSDYELEDGLDVMEVSRGNDAISESNAKTKKVFIPAHHSAETHLQIDVYCKFVDDNGKDIPGAYDDCYKNWVDEHKGLVVFDQAKRYEIRADLPKSMSKMD